MIRKTLNVTSLQEEIARRLHRMPAIQEEGVKIQVPRPRLRAPDTQGCNWELPAFGQGVGFKREIAFVLEAVRRDFNLTHDDDNGTQAAANPAPQAASKASTTQDNPFAALEAERASSRQSSSKDNGSSKIGSDYSGNNRPKHDPFSNFANTAKRTQGNPFDPAPDE